MRNSKTNWKVEMWEILTGKLCSRKPTFQNKVCGHSVELLPNTQLPFFFFLTLLLTKMTYCHNLENNSVRLCTGLKKIDIIKRIYSYNYSVSMDRTFNLHLYCKPPLYIKTSLFIMHTFINGKKRHTDICKFPWRWRTI